MRLLLAVLGVLWLILPAVGAETRDPRHITTGVPIPDEGYCDQPYVVITKDGNWLCTMTTGPGHEGQGGQHVVATTSTDRGRTWSKLVDIEPSTGPDASWVVPLVVPSGRVYGFYTYNGDRVETLRGKKIRVDMLGWYAYRYSDDNGRTWSAERYRLPIRTTACDRTNDWQGSTIIFWGICKPLVVDDRVFFSYTKLGKYMLDQGEGWLFTSDNLLRESDVAKIRWEMRPEGEHGIRAEEFGSVQEEHNLVSLGGDRLYCVYRTTTGYPCHAYSDDAGRTWSKPEHMTYTPGGQRIKNPRACPKVWRTAEGKYLFWFHNHSGRSYQDRNPAWLAGGVLKDGRIHWSQPEILLYDDDPKLRMSYPDLVQQDGRYWVTETQKTVARIHELDKELLEGLWSQGEVKTIAKKGLVLDAGPEQLATGELKLPGQIDVRRTSGLSVEMIVRLASLAPGQVLLDSRDAKGAGLRLSTTEKGTVLLEASDGTATAAWDCDAGVLKPGKTHHLTAIVDAGPKIVSFVVNGVLCDGGETRQFGWGRYTGSLGDVSGTGKLHVGSSLEGQVKRVRLYDRYLRTSEAVGNFQAARAAGEVSP